VPALLAATMMIGSGLWLQHWTSRADAQAATHLRAISAAMAGMPSVLGEWEGQPTDELDQADLPAETAGHACYIYRNLRTNQTVSVYLLCGPSRSVADHTPESCYPECSLRMDAAPVKCTVSTDRGEAELATSVFVREHCKASQRMRMFWSFAAQGTWEAPNVPAMRFGSARPLVKLYLISEEPLAQPPADSLGLEFAQLLLPATTSTLFERKSANDQ
jgi:hypothetical protein